MSEREIFKRFWAWVYPYRRKLFLSLFLVPFVAACSIAQPRILGLAIDEFMLAGDLAGLRTAALMFLSVVVLEYVIGATQIYLMMVVGARAVGDMRRDIYRHVMRQGQSFFDKRPTGSLLSRTTTDVEAVGESIFQGVTGLVSDSFRFFGMVSYMLWLDWKLTLVAFAALPVIVLLVDIFRKKLRKLSTQIRVYVAELNGFMQEHIAGVETVQLMGRQDRATEEFAQINRKALKSYHWSNFYDSGLYAIMDGISSICIGAVVWFGGASVWAGQLSPGLLVAFVEYVQRALIPIKEFSGRYATMQRSVAALHRVLGLLDTHTEPSYGTKRPEKVVGKVSFQNVTFAYPNTEKTVLNDVSFEVESGSVVALVGATGSGKSTVCRLVTRGYEGYDGNITIDGVDISELDSEVWRQWVVSVPQDVFLFKGSVAFNLGLGHPGVSHDDMVNATQLLQAHDFIEKLPNGLDSNVGHRGGNLSAGQGQLISFARAMCRDPAIVVLDEATSSIDPATEKVIQAAIGQILALKTVIVVAHRLSTIVAADLILVMDKGKIVERGTHEELIKMGKRYAALYESQLVEQAEPAPMTI